MQPGKATDKTSEPLMLKVCGMRQRENIQAVLAMQPDWLGFIFYPRSARYVGEELETAVLEQIPKSTRKTGVFVNAALEYILAAVAKYKLDAVQLHGEEAPAMCRQLKQQELLVLKAFAVDEAFDFGKLRDYEGSCDYYLFDTKGQDYGGNGIRFNWDILKDYSYRTPYFLSGGIDIEHADQIKALDLPLLKGVDINSHFELSPALKDSHKVQAFFEQMRQKH